MSVQRMLSLLLLMTMTVCPLLPLHAAEASTDALMLVQQGDYAGAEQWLAAHVRQHPDDIRSRFLLARVLSWQGKYDEALRQYDELLRLEPDNADYLFGKAQVLYWMKKSDQALVLLERIRREHPEYRDAWKLELRILSSAAEGGTYDAERLRSEAERLYPDESWWRGQVKSGGSESTTQMQPMSDTLLPWELAAGMRYDALSKGYDNWTAYFLSLQRRFSDGLVVYGAVEQTKRFRLRDNQWTLGAYLVPLPGLTMQIEGKFSPSANVLPGNSVLGQVLISLPEGWGVSAGIRRTGYPSASLWIYSGGLERYFDSFRASYTYNRVKLAQLGNGGNHVLSLDHYFGNGNSLGLVYTVGREVERLGPTRVLITPIWTLAARGRYWMNESWGIQWEAHFHHQGQIYRKIGGSLGLLRRF